MHRIRVQPAGRRRQYTTGLPGPRCLAVAAVTGVHDGLGALSCAS